MSSGVFNNGSSIDASDVVGLCFSPSPSIDKEALLSSGVTSAAASTKPASAALRSSNRLLSFSVIESSTSLDSSTGASSSC